VLLQPNPPWHHTILDQNLIDRILDAIPKVFIQNQIAHLCGIYPQRLSDWIKFGKRDMESGVKNSIYADFYQQYHEARAEALHQKLKHLSMCPKNYGAITFILERCFKDEFEVMSESHKQLLDLVENVIKPLLRQGGHLNEAKITQEAGKDAEEEISRS
jgi:hypothetical protein